MFEQNRHLPRRHLLPRSVVPDVPLDEERRGDPRGRQAGRRVEHVRRQRVGVRGGTARHRATTVHCTRNSQVFFALSN